MMDPVFAPGLAPYIAPFFLCCLVVSGVVEATKRSVWIWLETNGKPKPRWIRHVWRLEALVAGGLAGLLWGVAGTALFWYDGLAVGLGAGLLSTSVVALVQKWLTPKDSQ
jgi:hypothetical protein